MMEVIGTILFGVVFYAQFTSGPEGESTRGTLLRMGSSLFAGFIIFHILASLGGFSEWQPGDYVDHF